MKIKKIPRNVIIFSILIVIIINSFSIISIADQGDGNEGSSGQGGNVEEPLQQGQENKKGEDQGNGDTTGKQNQQQKQGQTQNPDSGKNNNNNQQQNQKGKEDNDGDEIDDRRERHQYRYMKMTFGKNRTQIRSEWQHNTSGDAFEVLFDIDKEPKITFDYIPDTKTSEIELSFIVTISNLFEYHDVNANGRYNKDDIIESTYFLENANFTDIEYKYENSSDGEEITIISTVTDDGIFSIVMYVTGNFSQINNQTLSPSEIKMDFIINNYPFVYSNTSIAIEIDLITEHETNIETVSFDEKQGYSKNESEINISSFKHNGFFSWADYVTVDNENRPVNVTVTSEKEETILDNETIYLKTRKVYFSYPQGTNIIHDPEMGVVSISYASFAESSIIKDITQLVNTLFTDLLAYVGICLFAGFFFICIIYFRKRMIG